MEHKHLLHTPMALEGWHVVYAKRPGPHADGSGIFYRSERFRVLRSLVINFNDLVPQDEGTDSAYTTPAYRADEEHHEQQGKHRLESPRMEHYHVAAFQEVNPSDSSNSPETSGGSSAQGASDGGRIVIVVSSHIYWYNAVPVSLRFPIPILPPSLSYTPNPNACSHQILPVPFNKWGSVRCLM
ncbi:unnamed protein product [Closterium sp. Naga37s-1]|nr:unnamed protein product [Closterium sp. Naga37s-1]